MLLVIFYFIQLHARLNIILQILFQCIFHTVERYFLTVKTFIKGNRYKKAL